MENQQRGFAVIILILIAVVVIGGGLYLYSRNSQLEQHLDSSPIATCTNATDTKYWKTYRN